MRKTKIISTIGPKTNSLEAIKKIILSGADAIRLNFSHDSREKHADTARRVMQAREELGIPTAIILDTKGPEIRTSVLAGGEDVELVAGSTFTLTTDEIEGDATKVSVTYQDLPKDLKEGARVLIDDGLIELVVKSINGNDVVTEVINGGLLGERKGVNLPDVFVNLPALTEKDIADITLGAEVGFDFIAASFIRCAADVIEIRKLLEKVGGSNIRIISKIENRDGVDNIDEILQVTDAIMVARGDLGVEIPPEEVPIVQKMLIRKCNELGKMVVTATQMLESMIKNPRPTRAEASDVANAIFDGTSAIMLSGETAKGDYPYESIKMMVSIAEMVEKTDELYNMTYDDSLINCMTTAISLATCQAAKGLDAAAIITATKSGHTVRALSKFKPKAPIVACTPDKKTQYQLNLIWGCKPCLMSVDAGATTDEVFAATIATAEKEGIVKKGDAVVITAGVPIGGAGTTNILKVQYVGDILSSGKGICDGVAVGTARVITEIDEASKNFTKGDVLIAHRTDDTYLPLMKLASAIVVEDHTKAENNHAVKVGKTIGVPVVYGAGIVTQAVENGLSITVDSKKGLVYSGVVTPQ
ncbi:MAG: pyruvate kinase [Epulopiscium sp. Nele67-Bin001]|nr:MAG: pyruvate kinase [Epulopiscium sp. Nele67-Bin001]